MWCTLSPCVTQAERWMQALLERLVVRVCEPQRHINCDCKQRARFVVRWTRLCLPEEDTCVPVWVLKQLPPSLCHLITGGRIMAATAGENQVTSPRKQGHTFYSSLLRKNKKREWKTGFIGCVNSLESRGSWTCVLLSPVPTVCHSLVTQRNLTFRLWIIWTWMEENAIGFNLCSFLFWLTDVNS